jgi:uroporphyrinogen-III synthase
MPFANRTDAGPPAEREQDSRFLSGIGVLVTRPEEQSHDLCQAIRAAGGEPVRFPVLAIEPIRDSPSLQAAMQRLEEFHWAIFISPNAVLHAFAALDAHGGLPGSLRTAAVGKGTARKLRSSGHPPHLVPPGRANSEALLEQPELQQVDGQRILIFRGRGGRELLAQTLRARGAEVEYAEVYRRVKPRANITALLDRWARGEVDVVTVTSNEGLHNLYEMVGEQGRQRLLDTPLVVVSERGAELARSLGFRREVRVSASADPNGLLAALRAWRGKAEQW